MKKNKEEILTEIEDMADLAVRFREALINKDDAEFDRLMELSEPYLKNYGGW